MRNDVRIHRSPSSSPCSAYYMISHDWVTQPAAQPSKPSYSTCKLAAKLYRPMSRSFTPAADPRVLPAAQVHHPSPAPAPALPHPCTRRGTFPGGRPLDTRKGHRPVSRIGLVPTSRNTRFCGERGRGGLA